MLASVQGSCELLAAVPGSRGTQSGLGPRIDAARELATGAVLFHEGDYKDCVYRVESGVICLFHRDAGRAEAISFAFPGDIVGLGSLDKHMWSAQASVSTRVCRLPREAVEAIGALTPNVSLKHKEASDLEFALLRDGLVQRSRPVETRLAALLLVISDTNAGEGRPRDIIEDDLTCGLVAQMLGLDMDSLTQALMELARRNLVRAEPEGRLRIVDRAGMERLVDAS